MKRLFQFSIRALLIAVTATSLFILWVQWPKKTALKFLEQPTRFVRSDPDESEQISNRWINWIESNPRELEGKELLAEKRSIIDILLGRQSFVFNQYELDVCRGEVTFRMYYTRGRQFD